MLKVRIQSLEVRGLLMVPSPLMSRTRPQIVEFAAPQGLYGPVLKAFAALEPAAQAALTHDLEALIERFNHSGDGTLVAPGE